MKSREQLLKEITELRKKVKELEKYELEFMNIAETLRRSEQEKTAILDAMFEFIVLLDDDLKILWTNKAVNRQFGLEPDQLRGNYCYVLFANLSKPCKGCSAQKVMESGEAIMDADKSFLGRSWAIRHYPMKGEKKVLVAYTDITEKKATEKALQEEQMQKDALLAHLRESEEKYKMIFQDSRDAIVIITKEGKIVAANKAFLEIFGISEEELDRVNMWDLVVLSKKKNKFIDDVEKKISVIDYPARMKKKDGTTIDCLVTSSVKYANDGSISGYQGIIRDVTLKKKLEREVLEISERERREIGHNLHDSLGQLLTGIALKSKSVSQTLAKKSIPEAKELQRIMDLANKAISQTRLLINGIVPASLEAGGILAAIRDVAITIKSLYDIPCEVYSNDPEMDLDNVTANQLYRIAQEAGLNAAKHSKASRISITLDRVDGKVILAIEDDGVGFSLDSALYEGRGLHIMNYRARMLDATLRIEKREEKGMSVTCIMSDKSSSK